MSFKSFIKISKSALREFSEKDPLRMAAATAFFTTFSLPAITFIFIELIGLFYNPFAVKHNIFTQLVSVIGRESSVKVYKILYQFMTITHNWFAAVAGLIFLVFVITTLFSVVRGSINDLWNIKVERNAGIQFHLLSRLKSAGGIFIACVLLVTQLIATSLEIFLKNYVDDIWNHFHFSMFRIISEIIFTIFAMGWFTVLFKHLANAHPDWRTAFTGGLFTAIYFTIGKIVLSFLLTFSMLSEVFGKTGGFVLILLFVFYCSFIFYYGVAFTKALLAEKKKHFKLDKHAHMYSMKIVKA